MLVSDYIKKLIRTNQNQRAIEVLEEIDDQNQSALVIQSSSLHKLKEDYSKGVLSFEESGRKLAQIQSVLLDILADQPVDAQLEVGSWESTRLNLWYFLLSYRKYLLTAILLLNALLIIYLYAVQSSSTLVNMELQLSRVEFNQVQGGRLFANVPLVDVQIQGVESTLVPCNEVKLDLDLDDHHEQTYTTDGQLTFNLSNPDPSIFFHGVRLNELNAIEGSKHILTLHPGGQNLAFLNLDIAKSHNTTIRLIFQDSVKFESENFQSNIPSIGSGLILGTAYFPGGSGEIVVSSSNDLITLFMVVDSINLSMFNLRVDSLRFTRFNETGSSISSINHATINLLTSKEENIYQSIIVGQGDFLRLVNQQNMQLLKLEIRDNAMSLRIKGKVDQVLVGNTADQMRSRNTTKLLYIWHNHRILVVIYALMVLCLLGGFTFLPRTTRL